MHPYKDLPRRQFWRTAVADRSWDDVAFSDSFELAIDFQRNIGCAGSCFAQHLGEGLRKFGISIYNTEPPHELHSDQERKINEQFSARYGNIYSSKQLLELVEQAFEIRPPIIDFCVSKKGYYDLLRPSIQPGGFDTYEECLVDRLYHLSMVKKLFTDLDYFVFTIGLTETWINKDGNYAYPVCPGVIAGDFDADKHAFVNLGYNESYDYLKKAINIIHSKNNKIKIILTVSPVQLSATFTNQHVLIASSYSKSILRAVVGKLEEEYSMVYYFPSFEITSHLASCGKYLEPNLREISPRGVAHVMKDFIAAGTKKMGSNPNSKLDNEYLPEKIFLSNSSNCEELMNDFSLSQIPILNRG